MSYFLDSPVKSQFKLITHHPWCAIIGAAIGFVIAAAWLSLYAIAIEMSGIWY